ncbi:MAG: DUF3800 domain-containing protein [Alphaproteobacteria bacterium]|nr:DUF3800 domain-containing protein [Alphaproteobacteria bacterium]
MRDIYADESSQTKHRFLVLGAITARTENVSRIVDVIRASRLPSLPHGEMKWTKVSRGKLETYRAVVDSFFTMSDADMMHFHALVIDTARLDHGRFNQGDREIGFSKMVFQLLNKHARLYPERLYAYLDKRTTRQSLDELRMILNRNAAKKLARPDYPFRRVVFRDSKESDLLQLNDVLLGAVAWIKNGHGSLPGASEAKNALASHVLSKSGLTSLDADSPRGKRRFTVWNFRLS